MNIWGGYGANKGRDLRIIGDAAITRLAAELRAEAELPPFSDPRFLALRLAIRLAQRVHHRERTTADLLVYDWHDDLRTRGARVHAELGESYLLRRRVEHSAPDAEALGLAVALPPEERRRGEAHLIWHQRWLPIPTIRAVCRALHL